MKEIKKWRQEESVQRSWLLKPHSHRSKPPILRSLVSGQHPKQTKKADNSRQKPMALPWTPWLDSAYSRLNSIFLPSEVPQEENQLRLTVPGGTHSNPLPAEGWNNSICEAPSLFLPVPFASLTILRVPNLTSSVARGKDRGAPRTVFLRTNRRSAHSGPNPICEKMPPRQAFL